MTKKLVLLMTALFVLSFIPAVLYASDNSTFRMDHNRTGTSWENIAPPLTEDWMAEFTWGETASQPAVQGDNVYTLIGQKLAKYNQKTGEKQETENITGSDEKTGSSVTIGQDGNLYFGTRANGFYSYTNNLQQRWHRYINGRVVSVPLIIDGVVIIGSGTPDNKLYFLDSSTGQDVFPPFEYSTEEVTSSPSLMSNNLLIGTTKGYGQGQVVKIDLNNGTEKRYETYAGVPACIAVEGSRFFFSDQKAYFYCYDNEGQRKWEVNYAGSGSSIYNSPAIYGDTVYFPVRSVRGGNGALFLVNKNDGSLIKRVDLPGQPYNAPLAWGEKGIVLVAVNNASEGKNYIIGVYTDGSVCNWYFNEGIKDKSLLPGTGPVTGEMSLAGAHLILGTNDGVLRSWKAFPLPNLYAKTITTRAGQNEKLKPGDQRQGSVVFGMDANITETRESKVQLMVNGNPVQLYEDGQPVDKSTFGPGQEKTFTFTWTAPAASKAVLTGTVNPDKWVAETNSEDNSVSAEVGIDCLDLWADNLDIPSSMYAGTLASGSVEFGNDSDVYLEPDIAIYLDGSEIKRDKISLAPGETTRVGFEFTGPNSGSHTIRASINPNHWYAEVTYDNNSVSKGFDIERFTLAECDNRQESWNVTYHVPNPYPPGGSTSYTRTYTQRVNMDVNIDTGFGDSRYWHRGKPQQQQFYTPNPLNSDHRTRAGYGYDVTVNTHYWTDWETKVPGGASRIGGKPPGIQAVALYVERTGEVVWLEPMNSKSSWDNSWVLPHNKQMNGNYRMLYTPENARDGSWRVVAVAYSGGWPKPDGVCATADDSMIIQGTMRDDIYTKIEQ